MIILSYFFCQSNLWFRIENYIFELQSTNFFNCSILVQCCQICQTSIFIDKCLSRGYNGRDILRNL